jgi:C-terminal processing protease CtpA/Prc
VFVQDLPTSSAPIYRGRTVMLIDERTISQAEHTGFFFRAASGTEFVGSTTAGASGDTTQLVLPGGLSMMFTGQEVRHPDGRPLQRIGIQPDVRAVPTIAGIRAGRDEVLEAALRHLGAPSPPPSPARAARSPDTGRGRERGSPRLTR